MKRPCENCQDKHRPEHYCYWCRENGFSDFIPSDDQQSDSREAVSGRTDGSAGNDCIERRCIVCSINVWWPRKSTLPPACGSHDYEEVFEAFEEPND